MIDQRVITVHESVPSEIMTGFFPATPTGWPRLARLCFWVLGRIQKSQDIPNSVKHVPWPPADNLAEEIFRQITVAYDVRGKEPTLVYIGGDQMDEVRLLSRECKPNAVFTYYRDREHAYGLPVELVPWMNGVLVV